MPYVVRDGQTVTWCSETQSGPWDQQPLNSVVQQSKGWKTISRRRNARRRFAAAKRWNVLNSSMLGALGCACFNWSVDRSAEVK